MDKEKIDLENFPTSESAKRMLGYVTKGFYDKSYVGKWIYQIMGIEWDAARDIFEDFPNQLFPETATWGLMYHEIKWGLPVQVNLSYEERRKLIYERRDVKAPMTPYRMELYLANVTGFDVRVLDIHDSGGFDYIPEHPNVFKVIFSGEGRLDIQAARDMLQKIKQSHTTFLLSERVTALIDNRDLETVLLKKIRIHLMAAFFSCYIFDGSWLFDGTILLNQRKRYYLEGKIALGMELKNPDEKIENVRVVTSSRNYWLFDGKVNMDGSRLFDSVYKEEGL